MKPERDHSTDDSLAAAYGGPGWQPRTRTTRQERGELWGPWAVDSEWAPLRAVLLHEPDETLTAVGDPNAAQLLDRVELSAVQQAHRALASAFAAAGVTVHALAPQGRTTPNLMFQADLFFMTPEGAILARPASTVRAGEERHVARRLAALDLPVLLAVAGSGVFEGADALWLDARTVLLATGLRTNAEGAAQVRWALERQGVRVILVELPRGAMHLMGTVRLAGPGLAVAWPGRASQKAIGALEQHGYRVLNLAGDARRQAMNFVTLGPHEVLMPTGCPQAQAQFEAAGIHCHTVEIDEIIKAAGGIGCLTGVLQRDPA